MKIKKAYVTRENPAEIFSLIEEAISTRPNTQVFVDNRIYEEFRYGRGSRYHVYLKNGVTDYLRYGNDCGEEWLYLSEGCVFDKEIASGSFIPSTKEYMRLVEFHSSKVKDYTHYDAGFKQLLLILLKPE